MYTLDQYLRLVDNREKVQNGWIDFNIFLKMSVSYHQNGEDENIAKADIVRRYIKYTDPESDKDFSKLKSYLDEVINSVGYQEDEECEKQMAEILNDVFEDIASWEDYNFQPVNITISHVNKDELETQLILLDEHFYYKLYRHIERDDLYIYDAGDETKFIHSIEKITTIKHFLELLCHTDNN